MDVEVTQIRAQLKLALSILEYRKKRLDKTTTRYSRHYSTVGHTMALISLLEEVLGLCEQDPSNWDDEPDLVPF